MTVNRKRARRARVRERDKARALSFERDVEMVRGTGSGYTPLDIGVTTAKIQEAIKSMVEGVGVEVGKVGVGLQHLAKGILEIHMTYRQPPVESILLTVEQDTKETGAA